jgi:hypothetical protein
MTDSRPSFSWLSVPVGEAGEDQRQLGLVVRGQDLAVHGTDFPRRIEELPFVVDA